jgi:hypothetical protein
MKSKSITNKEVPTYIGLRAPFKGHSIYATNKLNDVSYNYVVYSYGEHWPLAMYEEATGVWYLNKDKYSVTTSKHLTLTQRGVSGTVVWLGAADMKVVVAHGSPGLVTVSNRMLEAA